MKYTASLKINQMLSQATRECGRAEHTFSKLQYSRITDNHLIVFVWMTYKWPHIMGSDSMELLFKYKCLICTLHPSDGYV